MGAVGGPRMRSAGCVVAKLRRDAEEPLGDWCDDKRDSRNPPARATGAISRDPSLRRAYTTAEGSLASRTKQDSA